PYGLMLVTMEPSPADEVEFHEWYDLEHIPERQRVPGFLSATRYVCLDGWPRYLALYDLSGIDVLASAPYHAISGDKFSPWSQRVRAGVRGRYTAAAEQIAPGNAVIGAKGACSRLVLLRFRGLSETGQATLQQNVDAAYAEQPGILQIRHFR